MIEHVVHEEGGQFGLRLNVVALLCGWRYRDVELEVLQPLRGELPGKPGAGIVDVCVVEPFHCVDLEVVGDEDGEDPLAIEDEFLAVDEELEDFGEGLVVEEGSGILGDSEAVLLEDGLDVDIVALVLEDGVDLTDVLLLHHDH